MKTNLRVFSFLLCTSLMAFWPARASAQTSEATACSTLAANIQVLPRAPSNFQQMIQRQAYLKCMLSSQGQVTAPDTSEATGASATYVSFVVPGSTCLPAFAVCTHPTAISAAGAMTGIYSDSMGAIHGFLRAPNGIITAFDPPGSVFTDPTGINPEGAITGEYCDAVACHAFLRAPNGTFTVFDVPGATYTWNVVGVTLTGAIGGSYLVCTPGCLEHGFLRIPQYALILHRS
jgi:hypothetical protein